MTFAPSSALNGVLASIPSPQVSYIDLGPLRIHFYALCIIAGIIAATLLTNWRLTKRGAEPWVVIDISLIAVPLAIIGARIFHVVTHPGFYFGEGTDIWAIFRIWEGGIAIYGALIGGAIGAGVGMAAFVAIAIAGSFGLEALGSVSAFGALYLTGASAAACIPIGAALGMGGWMGRKRIDVPSPRNGTFLVVVRSDEHADVAEDALREAVASEPPATNGRPSATGLRESPTDPAAGAAGQFAYEAVYAGALGGTVIALFFLVLDSLVGRPLATASLMGTALFTELPPDPTAEIRHDMVALYSVVHFGVFFLLGALASTLYDLLGGAVVTVIVAIFALLTGVFALASVTVLEGAGSAIGWHWVVLVNLATAVAMGRFIGRARDAR
jgi:hypothetical protein